MSWYLVTYEGQARYQIMTDSAEAKHWVRGTSTAKCHGYKIIKEVHDEGELHHSFVTWEKPRPFVPHVNFITN